MFFPLAVLLANPQAPAQPALQYLPSNIPVPAPPREFRGVWLASVKNIDWPSKPGLTTAEQKSELLALLDRAQALRLNAVLLQIRPSCDAFYASRIEPWSEYLTGRMGRAPAPFYDPLEFAVEEAHRRGLELHAWFNPYRARHAAAFSAISPDHISRTHPTLAKQYGKSLWLDPGEREVQEHSLRVVMDVVQRYDVDGIHFDDYFYPYPEKDAQRRQIPFPDWSSWKRYKDSGGKLEREDWRRENVNLFITRVSQSIKAARPWVRFGISPFGIWRPGYPAQIKGLDAYGELYADARKWLREGWVDYLAPQLYWAEEKRETSFTALLPWWLGENVKQRHVWPGLDISRVGGSREPQEIASQIHATRREAAADGNILWGARALTENRRGLSDILSAQLYQHPALTPANPWNDQHSPETPRLRATAGSPHAVHLSITPGATNDLLRFWVLRTQKDGAWTMHTIPAGKGTSTLTITNSPEAIAVSAIDRSGNSSKPAVLSRQSVPPPATSR
jgi:uncharacterized lipoprotein YddW (UPF0748 family)